MDHATTRTRLEPVSLLLFAFAWLLPVPAGAAFSDGFVGCSTSDDAFAFDLDTYAVGAPLDLLPEGNYPYDATIRPDGAEVWLVGASGDGVVVVDRGTNTITHRIATGEYPTSIAFSNDGTLALVSCRDTEEVTRIDTETYLVTGSLALPTGIDGGNLALDPVSGNFYLVDWYDGTLFEIAPDGSAILRDADLGDSLWQLVVDPDGSRIFVTDRGTDQVRVIERATLTQSATVAVGDDPWGIDITQSGDRLVVVCEDSHEAFLIDAGTLTAEALALDGDADPRDVDIRDDRGRAFVCGGRLADGSDPIYVIDLAGGIVETSFEANGTNPNVVAVQAQMHAESNTVSGSPDLEDRARLTAFPHPLVAGSTLRYTLPRPGTVELTLHDATGRRIAVLDRGHRAAGTHGIAWSFSGERWSPGVSFARLLHDGEVVTFRLVGVR
ncbi:MAG: beta-propeller fold lactonase family protein [Candidatus Eisenbacteria bacterium]|nr:beta-propeller fold lactonase family protein [Candidatus Latescibacterota bacterium]MBD3303351.1 beta-propeller fold lactonase family protein [Candidatus Eisenbacteria bacterium]